MLQTFKIFKFIAQNAGQERPKSIQELVKLILTAVKYDPGIPEEDLLCTCAGMAFSSMFNPRLQGLVFSYGRDLSLLFDCRLDFLNQANAKEYYVAL